ncbi:hypothetical protein E2C01_086084 [Portunus trituberculatus]|uniref:Uncharacterized protein n=1 Tax=Portunus trituberculatus TaxID=210409 RepID=A0A5B7IZU5_PORTR|nr:hypothetical protein [Portunus trituberculatus]
MSPVSCPCRGFIIGGVGRATHIYNSSTFPAPLLSPQPPCTPPHPCTPPFTPMDCVIGPRLPFFTPDMTFQYRGQIGTRCNSPLSLPTWPLPTHLLASPNLTGPSPCISTSSSSSSSSSFSLLFLFHPTSSFVSVGFSLLPSHLRLFPHLPLSTPSNPRPSLRATVQVSSHSSLLSGKMGQGRCWVPRCRAEGREDLCSLEVLEYRG